jgi:hypothetical protein
MFLHQNNLIQMDNQNQITTFYICYLIVDLEVEFTHESCP